MACLFVRITNEYNHKSPLPLLLLSGILLVVFWSIEIAGDNPSIVSTSGLSICPKIDAHMHLMILHNVFALQHKSSNAKDDLPDPDNPVITINLFLEVQCLRLLSYVHVHPLL